MGVRFYSTCISVVYLSLPRSVPSLSTLLTLRSYICSFPVTSHSVFRISFVRSFVRFLHRISFVPFSPTLSFRLFIWYPCILLHTPSHLLTASLVFTDNLNLL